MDGVLAGFDYLWDPSRPAYRVIAGDLWNVSGGTTSLNRAPR